MRRADAAAEDAEDKAERAARKEVAERPGRAGRLPDRRAKQAAEAHPVESRRIEGGHQQDAAAF